LTKSFTFQNGVPWVHLFHLPEELPLDCSQHTSHTLSVLSIYGK